jgi:two-component system chemotaxis sensor kinase CheA
MEDLLHAVDAGQATLDRDRLSLLFKAADVCERILKGEADAAVTDPETEALLEALAPPANGECGMRNAECDPPSSDPAHSAFRNPQSAMEGFALTEYEALAAADAEGRGLTCYLLRAEVDPRCRMPGAGAFLVWRQLQGTAEVLRFDPSPEGEVPVGCREFTVLLASAHDAQSLERRAILPGIVSAAHALPIADCGMRSAPLASPQPEPANPQSAIRNPQSVLGASTILVDTRRIDRVMNLVGELVMARSMFHQAFAALQPRSPQADFLAGFREAQRLMDRSLTDLQKGVMQIRMVPIDRVFHDWCEIWPRPAGGARPCAWRCRAAPPSWTKPSWTPWASPWCTSCATPWTTASNPLASGRHRGSRRWAPSGWPPAPRGTRS